MDSARHGVADGAAGEFVRGARALAWPEWPDKSMTDWPGDILYTPGSEAIVSPNLTPAAAPAGRG